MKNRFDCGHLFAALGGGTAGHHGFLIPAEATSNLAQGLCVAFKGHQFIKCGHAQ
jgi:hypothetical protein